MCDVGEMFERGELCITYLRLDTAEASTCMEEPLKSIPGNIFQNKKFRLDHWLMCIIIMITPMA